RCGFSPSRSVSSGVCYYAALRFHLCAAIWRADGRFSLFDSAAVERNLSLLRRGSEAVQPRGSLRSFCPDLLPAIVFFQVGAALCGVTGFGAVSALPGDLKPGTVRAG